MVKSQKNASSSRMSIATIPTFHVPFGWPPVRSSKYLAVHGKPMPPVGTCQAWRLSAQTLKLLLEKRRGEMLSGRFLSAPSHRKIYVCASPGTFSSAPRPQKVPGRSEEHTSELQALAY